MSVSLLLCSDKTPVKLAARPLDDEEKAAIKEAKAPRRRQTIRSRLNRELQLLWPLSLNYGGLNLYLRELTHYAKILKVAGMTTR
jgi:hypothetical protein